MIPVEHDLLGSSALYVPFRLVTEVLGKFVSCAPRALSLSQLEQQTTRSARELTRLCGVLCREQLLQPDPKQKHGWRLACSPAQLTLEDAFRCALAVQATRVRTPKRHTATPAEGQREVELLMTQAAMDINQSVFQHLRRFSLDRLKATPPVHLNPWERLHLPAAFV